MFANLWFKMAVAFVSVKTKYGTFYIGKDFRQSVVQNGSLSELTYEFVWER